MNALPSNRDKIYASERLKVIREELKELIERREQLRPNEDLPRTEVYRRQRIYVLERIVKLKEESETLKLILQNQELSESSIS